MVIGSPRPTLADMKQIALHHLRSLLYQPQGLDVRISINDNEELAKNTIAVLRLNLADR